MQSPQQPQHRLSRSSSRGRVRPCTTRRQAYRRAAIVMLALGVAPACGRQAAVQPNAQSESAQSVAEYDVAVDLWLKRGQPRLALEHALNAVELDDEHAAANHLVALLYLDFCRRDPKECRLAEAERYSRQAIDSDPEMREASNTLGVILIHQHRFADAIAVLKPLTADILYRTPENAWGNLGWAYLELGQLEPAVEALLRSTAIQPNFCVGHYRLGVAYEKKNDDAAAYRAYGRALSVDHPSCKTLQVAYAARGRTALRLGRQDDAVSDLEECVHLAKTTETGRECDALLAPLQ